MHIPDGFLSGQAVIIASALSIGGSAVSLRHVRRHLPQRRVPMLGLAGAFIFAAQMLNFPIPGGASGHLMGGALTAVLLGPAAACLVLTAVLIIQCFVFADGGILALGANVFNMAIVGSAGGYAVYRVLHPALRRWLGGARGRLVGAAFAGWCSVMLAASCCAGELAMSDTASLNVVFPALLGIHAIIGVGEAAITALVLVAIEQTRPELLRDVPVTGGRRGVLSFIVYGGLISLGLAIFVAPFASSWPDGLETVAHSLGIGHQAAATPTFAPVPDYTFSGSSSIWATGLAGAIGAGLAFVLSLVVARVLVPRCPADEPAAAPSA